MHPRLRPCCGARQGRGNERSSPRCAGVHVAGAQRRLSPWRRPACSAALLQAVKLRGLYAITPEGDGVVEKVTKALAGGIALLQYRRKNGAAPEEAKALRALARRHGVPFIVNDDVGLAIA